MGRCQAISTTLKRSWPQGDRSLLRLSAKLHGSHQSGSSACPACRPTISTWSRISGAPKALLSSRRKIQANGEAKHDQDGLELAKPLWSCVGASRNSAAVSEEQQAIAELEKVDEGFVHRFRSIIRQLVNIFDHSHSEAQANIRLKQLRQDIRAVDDDHLEKILTFFDDHWEQALRYLRKKRRTRTGVVPTRSRQCGCCDGLRKAMTAFGSTPPGSITSRSIRRSYLSRDIALLYR